MTKKEVQKFWNQNPCGSQKVEKQFGSIEFYNEYDNIRFTRHPYLDEVYKYENYRGKKVLEIGVGLGADIGRFVKFGARAYGIDLTPMSIELTKKRFELFNLNGIFCIADAENLPFSDSCFDLVISIGVLHHTPDTEKAVNEIYRVLKDGGRAIIMLYYKNSWVYRIGYYYIGLFEKKFRYLSRQEFVSKYYDGDNNPLGKVYSKKDVKRIFSRFDRLEMRIYNFSKHIIPIIWRITPHFLDGFFDALSNFIGSDIYIFADKGNCK